MDEIISNEANINRNLTQKQLDDIILSEQARENLKYENIKEALFNQKNSDKKIAISKEIQNLSKNKEQELERIYENFNKNSRLAETIMTILEN